MTVIEDLRTRETGGSKFLAESKMLCYSVKFIRIIFRCTVGIPFKPIQYIHIEIHQMIQIYLEFM